MKRFTMNPPNRRLLIGLGSLLLLGGMGYLGLRAEQAGEKKETAPMKMQMEKGGSPAPEGQVAVMLTPRKQQLLGVKTAAVAKKRLEKVIRTVGRVDYDETTLATVDLKISGWIEKLRVDHTGSVVGKAEPLFTLYSPELVQTQEEYLLALKFQEKLKHSPLPESRRGSKALLEASRNRLLFWGISPQQVADLERRGRMIRAVPILSPVSGYVTEKAAIEGMHVKPGMALYKIADLSTVWVYADIYEYELPVVAVGQKATIRLSYLPGKTYEGSVTYIYPYLNEASRTATVRLEFPNPGNALKPGMYADVEIRAPVEEALAVPETAILDSGVRQVVFVAKGKGMYAPREVKIGPRIGRNVIVLSGLNEGERVVTHGTFLMDSESKMMAAMEGMMGLIGMGDWKMEHAEMGEMEMEGMDMKDGVGMEMPTKKKSGGGHD